MRKPNNHFVRKEDLIYTPNVSLSDGFTGGLSAVAGDKELATQFMKAAFDIQKSDDNLRRSITEQQNSVLLLDAKNRLSAINKSSYENLKYDADKFKIETNEQASKVINELPLLLRGKAKESFVQEQNDYYYRALNNQREYLDRQTSEQAQLTIQNSADKATKNIEGMFHPNAAVRTTAQLAFGFNIGESMSLLETKDSYGRDVFSPLQKHKLYQGFLGPVMQKFAELNMSAIPTIEGKLDFLKKVINGDASFTYTDHSFGNEIEVSFNSLDQKGRNAIGKILTKNLKEYVKLQKEASAINYVDKVLKGEILPLVNTEQHVNSTNIFYDHVRQKYGLENLGTADPVTINQVGSSMCGFVSKIGTIPTHMQKDLEALQNSGNPNLFKMVANVVSFIRANVPTAVDQLNEKNLAESITMARLADLGIPAEEAYLMIDQNFWKTTPEIRERRLKDFNTLYPKINISADVMSKLGSAVYNSKTRQVTQYEEEYEFLTQQYFLKGASLDIAKETAKTVLDKKWSIIKGPDGNKQLQAYAPEKFFANAILTPEDMRVELEKFSKQFVDDVENIRVVADETTYRQLGGPAPTPSYVLYVVRNGIPEIVENELGKPVRVGTNVWRTPRLLSDMKEYDEWSKVENELDVAIAELERTAKENYMADDDIHNAKVMKKNATKEKENVRKNRVTPFENRKLDPETAASYKNFKRQILGTEQWSI